MLTVMLSGPPRARANSISSRPAPFRIMPLDRSQNFPVVDHSPQSIAAQQQHVLRAQRLGMSRRVHDQLRIRSHRRRQNIALRMRLRFLPANHPRLHQPSDIGVIARYLNNSAVADQVKTGVSDMHEVEPVVDDRDRGARRPHAAQ